MYEDKGDKTRHLYENMSPRNSFPHSQDFGFINYDVDDTLDYALITRSDSGGHEDVEEEKKNRKRQRPEPSSFDDERDFSGPLPLAEGAKDDIDGYCDQDLFRNEIQERIPNLHSERKQGSSTSSSFSSSDIPRDNTTIGTEKKQSISAPTAEQSQMASSVVSKSQYSGPKRPKTAYIIFLEHFRQLYNEQHPNSTFNECQKEAGKKWRSLSILEKQPWKDLEMRSQKDFIRKMHFLQSSFGLVDTIPSDNYDFDSFSCHKNNGNSQDIIGGKNEGQADNQIASSVSQEHEKKFIMNDCQARKLNELMKGPKNAFSLYVNAMREECRQNDPSLTYNQIQKYLSGKWRQMHNEEKSVWIDKAEEIKQQLQEFSETLAAQGFNIDFLKKSESHRVKSTVALPKGPRSAYTLFYQCARKQLHGIRPDLNFQDYPTICSKIWRDMPQSEKALWKADSMNDRIRYEQELLTLAHSDVANTATSIVMEERLKKMNLHFETHNIDKMLATRDKDNSSCPTQNIDCSPSRKKYRGKDVTNRESEVKSISKNFSNFFSSPSVEIGSPHSGFHADQNNLPSPSSNRYNKDVFLSNNLSSVDNTDEYYSHLVMDSNNGHFVRRPESNQPYYSRVHHLPYRDHFDHHPMIAGSRNSMWYRHPPESAVNTDPTTSARAGDDDDDDDDRNDKTDPSVSFSQYNAGDGHHRYFPPNANDLSEHDSIMPFSSYAEFREI